MGGKNKKGGKRKTFIFKWFMHLRHQLLKHRLLKNRPQKHRLQ